MFNLILSLFLSFSYGQLSNTQSQEVINVNELKNGGAESGLTGWTRSGGLSVTVNSHTDSSKQFGKKYFFLDLDALNTKVFSQTIALPDVLKNNTCTLSFMYRNDGLMGNVSVVDSTAATIITTGGLGLPLSTSWRKVEYAFDCGTSDSLTVNFFTSTATGILEIDNVSLSMARQKQDKFFWQGRIKAGSAVEILLPFNSVGNYISPNDTNLLIEQRPGVGAFIDSLQPVYITCETGVTASGANCGGSSENLGIDIFIPKKGRYEFCVQYVYRTQDNSDIASVKIAETNRNDHTIIQDGWHIVQINGDSSNVGDFPTSHCESFNFFTSGRKAIRLFGRRGDSANVEVHLRDSTNPLSVLTWTVKEL